MSEDNLGDRIAPPRPRSAKIPLTLEEFSVDAIPRQLTLSYRLLPPKRRKSASMATCGTARACINRMAVTSRIGAGDKPCGAHRPKKQHFKSLVYVANSVDADARRTGMLRYEPVPAHGPGPRSQVGRQHSVRLPAQECRDFKLVVIHRLLHRQCWPAVDIKALRRRCRRPSGVLRDRRHRRLRRPLRQGR
jgi:hypothetical protein